MNGSQRKGLSSWTPSKLLIAFLIGLIGMGAGLAQAAERPKQSTNCKALTDRCKVQSIASPLPTPLAALSPTPTAKPPKLPFPVDPPGIVGGHQAAAGAWPWQARLTIRANNGATGLCGGSLIDVNWVVTAAHCVMGALPGGVQVTLGDLDRTVVEPGEQVLAGAQIIIHPAYDSVTQNNDIALIKLVQAAHLTDRVHVIKLTYSPQHDGVMRPGVVATITGWGATREGGAGSHVLMEASVPIVANATCNGPAAYNGRITGTMLCAGFAQGGVDDCQGDSGGPLVVRDAALTWRLAGIVSWGIGCARANFYGVYTRVSAYTRWLQAQIPTLAEDGVPLLDRTLLRETLNSAEYVIYGGAKFFVSDFEFIYLGYKQGDVHAVPPGTLAHIPNVPRDGTILQERSSTQFNIVFGGATFLIPNIDELTALGYTLANEHAVPNGSLYQIPSLPHDGTLLRERLSTQNWVVFGGGKFIIPNQAEFDALHYKQADVHEVPKDALRQFKLVPIKSTLLQERLSTQIYVTFGGAKFLIPNDAEFTALGYRKADVHEAPKGALALLLYAPWDGTLLRERSMTMAYYVVFGGAKFEIQGLPMLTEMGYRLSSVQVVPDHGLAQIPDVPRDRTLLREWSQISTYVILDGKKHLITSSAKLAEYGGEAHVKIVPPNTLSCILSGGNV